MFIKLKLMTQGDHVWIALGHIAAITRYNERTRVDIAGGRTYWDVAETPEEIIEKATAA